MGAGAQSNDAAALGCESQACSGRAANDAVALRTRASADTRCRKRKPPPRVEVRRVADEACSNPSPIQPAGAPVPFIAPALGPLALHPSPAPKTPPQTAREAVYSLGLREQLVERPTCWDSAALLGTGRSAYCTACLAFRCTRCPRGTVTPRDKRHTASLFEALVLL